jgi:homocitrate synthase NifV
MGKIYFVDVTNRDGVQTARLGLSKLEKTMINLYMDEMGVFQSEFGFPTTKHERRYLLANLKLQEMGVLKNIRLSGWTRGLASDVEEAFRAIPTIKHLNVSSSTSDQMIQGKYRGRKTRDDVISDMTAAVDKAYELGAETVGVNCEDGSRTDLDFLIRFASEAKKHGATRLRYCDTLGYESPKSIYDTIYALATAVKMDIEIHTHGDLGLAVATSISGAMAAVDAGQDAYINTTINGVGERAGNADFLSCVLSLMKAKGIAGKYELGIPIKLERIWDAARFASYAFNVPIPINQPGVGRNCFAHASGIHADGVLKDPENYELYGYKELGRGEPITVNTGSEICAGEYSGINGFKHVVNQLNNEDANLDLALPEDRDAANRILELVRYANVESHKPLVEEELIFIIKYPEIAKELLTMTPLDY